MTVEIKQLVDQIGAKHAEISEQLKTINAETKGTATEAKAALAAAEKAVDEIKTLGNRIAEVEQKTAQAVQRGTEAPETLGQMLIKSDNFKRFAEGSATKMTAEFKNVLLTQGSPGVADSTLVSPDRQGLVGGPTRALRLRDVIPSGTTGSNLIEYPRELAFTNGAAETADGQAVPESSLEFEMVQRSVQGVGTFIVVSKRVLEDSAMLASYVDTRLRYGVELRIDNQLVAGNGIGQNISGMTKAGNFVVFTPVNAETMLDSMSRAAGEVAIADYAATAFLLNPADWSDIERIKDNTGRYMVGNPSGSILAANLWGLPVVVTNAIPRGKFFCGAMDVAFQIFNRAATTVTMSESDGSNFKAGLITVKAEAQLALASARPGSTRFGDLLAA